MFKTDRIGPLIEDEVRRDCSSILFKNALFTSRSHQSWKMRENVDETTETVARAPLCELLMSWLRFTSALLSSPFLSFPLFSSPLLYLRLLNTFELISELTLLQLTPLYFPYSTLFSPLDLRLRWRNQRAGLTALGKPPVSRSFSTKLPLTKVFNWCAIRFVGWVRFVLGHAVSRQPPSGLIWSILCTLPNVAAIMCLAEGVVVQNMTQRAGILLGALSAFCGCVTKTCWESAAFPTDSKP